VIKKYYAHSTKTKDKSDWQLLEEHLRNVAEMAAEFAMPFGAEEWGRCAGILHDLGKASEEFQSRLNGANIRVDHSTFGAREAQTLRWTPLSRQNLTEFKLYILSHLSLVQPL